MHTEPHADVPPPFPEFPAAIAAAFLIMAAICLAAPIHDRYVLSAMLAAVGLAAGMVALVSRRRGSSAEVPAASGEHH